MDPDLLDKSLRLLRTFDWQGVAMVEYKREETSGTPYLMEINGRFWGSLQLAIDAGVDFPSLLVEAALGRARPPVTRYRSGLRLRSWWGDVDSFLARMRHSPERLSLPPNAPDRLRVLTEFFHWRNADRMETFRFADPGPFVRDTLQWLSARARRRS
jgi:hypothetical protein